MNEMNAKLALLTSEEERKAYIKSREKELKKRIYRPAGKSVDLPGKGS